MGSIGSNMRIEYWNWTTAIRQAVGFYMVRRISDERWHKEQRANAVNIIENHTVRYKDIKSQTASQAGHPT